jgi:ribosomal protein L29
MNMSELQPKTDQELRELRAQKFEALRTFRFNIAGSQIRSVREGRTLRKDIARINTELSARRNKTEATETAAA